MTKFCKFESEKYTINGAYHWMWYQRKPKYIRHVNHVKEWVQEKNVLDVGAGDGLITSVLGIRGIDHDPVAVRLAKEKGVEITLGDAHNLPYADEEFDSVFMGDALEHLEFPEKAISEARRVSKKYLYIVVSIVEGPFRISQEEFRQMVEKEGFILEGEIWAEDKAFWGKFKKVDVVVSVIEQVVTIPPVAQATTGMRPQSAGDGSHLPVLIKIMSITDGPVLEMGMGTFSTNFLHWACYANRRKLVSYDSGPHMLEWSKTFINDYHQCHHVEDWNKVDVSGHWSVALIDHSPGDRRVVDIERLANSVDYIVAHDSQPERDRRYKYSRVHRLFKYRKDFGRENPITTVFSNFKDLTDLNI